MRLLFVVTLLATCSAAEGSSVDYSKHEIIAKIVYYGPWSEGLRDNLQYIYKQTEPEPNAQKRLSLPIDREMVLNFDFLPLKQQKIHGYHVRFDLYAVVGQSDYDTVRRLTLKHVDGVVFVADSDPARMQLTLDSWKQLKQILADQGRDYRKMPITVQLDHRDHPKAVPVAEMKRLLEIADQPVLEAVSSTGTGVFASFKSIMKQVLTKLEKGATD